jgi:hypothetical protein
MIIEKDFSDNEIFEISELYTRLVKAHDLCSGTGLSYTKENRVENCICESVFNFCKELIYANIPKGYWGVCIKDLENYFIVSSEYKTFKNICFEESALFGGISGSGKTSFLSLLGKLAIFDRKSAFYTTSENLLKILKNDEILVDRIYGAEIILLDSLEKYIKSSWASGQIEYLLRNLKDRGKVIYIATSVFKNELENLVGSGIAEFINCQMNYTFSIDFNKKRKSLKVVNFFEKSFAKEASDNFQEVLEVVEAV